jgi:uncharacterized protein
MNLIRLAIVAAIAFAPLAASAASFDCAKASTLIENAVCTNPELSRKDETLARLYQSALKQNPSIRSDQVNWLRERNRCVDERCLINAYDRRIDELRVISTAPDGNANASGQSDARRKASEKVAVETKPAPSPAARMETSMKDPAQAARSLQMAGVSRCIAATVIMSAGLVQDPKIKASGPEIRNNNTLMGFYGDARKHLIRSMNNPAVEGAIDNMVRQQGEYFGNLVRFQGWDAFMPEYKQCRDGAYQ